MKSLPVESSNGVKMNSQLSTLIFVAVLLAGTTWTSVQTTPQSVKPKEDAEPTVKGSTTIAVGIPIYTALNILDDAGFKDIGGAQMASNDPDAKVTWRKISDGIEIALFYSNATQSVTMISMIYIPPTYDHRGNYRVVPSSSVTFNPDGSYAVTFIKPKPLSGK